MANESNLWSCLGSCLVGAVLRERGRALDDPILSRLSVEWTNSKSSSLSCALILDAARHVPT